MKKVLSVSFYLQFIQKMYLYYWLLYNCLQTIPLLFIDIYIFIYTHTVYKKRLKQKSVVLKSPKVRKSRWLSVDRWGTFSENLHGFTSTSTQIIHWLWQLHRHALILRAATNDFFDYYWSIFSSSCLIFCLVYKMPIKSSLNPRSND